MSTCVQTCINSVKYNTLLSVKLFKSYNATKFTYVWICLNNWWTYARHLEMVCSSHTYTFFQKLCFSPKDYLSGMSIFAMKLPLNWKNIWNKCKCFWFVWIKKNYYRDDEPNKDYPNGDVCNHVPYFPQIYFFPEFSKL